MDCDKPCLHIAGDGAGRVKEALLAKLAPPIVIRCPFDVKIGVEPGRMVHTVSPHDSADFAAEKLLDVLAEREWIQLDGRGLTPAEEQAMRDRLLDLGYLE